VIDQLHEAINFKDKNKSLLPIGVFDSGLGGLTVVKQLLLHLPDESIIYFGDTARLPYGTKSVSTIRKFSLQIARFLQDQGVKIIVVACNTASSLALNVIKENISVPVLGVIEPGVSAALRVSKTKSIGVIGTTATILSGAYKEALQKLDPEVNVNSVACPLFVPLVEEGWERSDVAEMIARKYLDPIINTEVDTLILGCTHYPILKDVLQRVVDNRVIIIDSSIETARQVHSILQSEKIHSPRKSKPTHKFYVSDRPQRFEEIAERFLGELLPNVKQISLDDYH